MLSSISPDTTAVSKSVSMPPTSAAASDGLIRQSMHAAART